MKKTVKASLLFFTLMVFLCINVANAQEEKTKGDFVGGLEGMVGIMVNPRVVAISIGGPNLRFKLRDNLSIGIAGFPSLFYSPNLSGGIEKDRKFEPKLGISPRIDYKKIVFMVPAFHFSNPDRWIWTIGLGYKFL